MPLRLLPTAKTPSSIWRRVCWAGYVISSLAAINAGNLDLAEEEYGRAVLLATLTVKGQCKPRSIDWPMAADAEPGSNT